MSALTPTPVAAASNRWTGYPAALALCALFAVLFVFVANASTLWDRDEPRFSRCAVEMVESGDYLIPTFNGELRAHKPVLIYWLMSVPIRVLGQTELAVRLPSVLGLCGSMLLCYWMARRLFDARAGILALCILATTPLSLMIGTAATADGTLLFFCTASLALMVHGATSRWNFGHVIALGLIMGLGQLTKGPVAIAFPLLGYVVAQALAWRVTKQKVTDVTGFPWWAMVLATVISFVVIGAWFIPVNNATQGQFAQEALGRHVIDRTMKPLEGHGGNWFVWLPYYVPIILGGFFPWTLFLLGALRRSWSELHAKKPGVALVLGYALGGFMLMTAVSTKLPHYILPIWPALAVLVAGTASAAWSNQVSDKEKILLHRGGMLFAPVAFGAAIVLGIGTMLLRHHGLPDAMVLPCVVLVATVLMMGLEAVREHLKYQFARSAVTLVCGMIGLQLLLAFVFLPAVETVKPVPDLAHALQQKLGRESFEKIPLATRGFGEPSFNFYADRNVTVLPKHKDLQPWLDTPGPRVVVTTLNDLGKDPANDLENLLRANPSWRVLVRIDGINYSNGQKIALLALGREIPGAE